jgi:predicted nucleic acid-binding protein
VNTSPLILLTKAGRLDLLRLGGVEVLVRDTVGGEIEAGAGYDATIDAIRQLDWLSVVPCPALPDPVQNCGLDPGESAVLALALGDPGSEVVLDDLDATDKKWGEEMLEIYRERLRIQDKKAQS